MQEVLEWSRNNSTLDSILNFNFLENLKKLKNTLLSITRERLELQRIARVQSIQLFFLHILVYRNLIFNRRIRKQTKKTHFR